MTGFLDLSRLVPGDRVQDPFLVTEVETRGGDKPHTILTLANPSGTLQSAPFWAEDQPKIEGIAARMVVHVEGELTLYRDRRQLRVAAIRPATGDLTDPAGFLPSVGDIAPYWDHLDRHRRQLDAPRLRAVLDLFYEDPEFRRRYGQCPASTAGHHARLGGLLAHTAEVAAIGLAISRECGADRGLVVAGALLHDIGKLEAYRWDGAFEPTDLHFLQGHVVLGALMLDRAVRSLPQPPCTRPELAILLHLILSHHGRQEFGAPVAPLTLEAEVLHYADNASAKTASMNEAMKEGSNFPGGALISSPGLWQVDRRRLYRGRSGWGREPGTRQREAREGSRFRARS